MSKRAPTKKIDSDSKKKLKTDSKTEEDEIEENESVNMIRWFLNEKMILSEFLEIICT